MVLNRAQAKATHMASASHNIHLKERKRRFLVVPILSVPNPCKLCRVRRTENLQSTLFRRVVRKVSDTYPPLELDTFGGLAAANSPRGSRRNAP